MDSESESTGLFSKSRNVRMFLKFKLFFRVYIDAGEKYFEAGIVSAIKNTFQCIYRKIQKMVLTTQYFYHYELQ